jgi:hypothetical protein
MLFKVYIFLICIFVKVIKLIHISNLLVFHFHIYYKKYLLLYVCLYVDVLFMFYLILHLYYILYYIYVHIVKKISLAGLTLECLGNKLA